jgi:preflagellin peptidase FlaK
MFSVVQILGNVVRNLSQRGRLFEGLQHEPASKKLLAIMVGHRSRNPKYAFSIERIINGRREFDFGIKPAETAQYETRNDVWVTSATPFLIFLAAGFLAMILFGDILAVLFNSL